ncbi:MAG: response regulator [Bryobacteraceae bacterium]|nr:response regulator [Bryobacteraceae bacterium]
MLSTPELLLIEDDPGIRRFLRASLAAGQYRLCECETGQDGLAQAAARQPELIILDLGLPDMDGVALIRQVRSWSQIPIIVLSAQGQESVKIAALDAGADDFVSKPFAVGELTARIRAALRRSAGLPGGGQIFRAGRIEVDLDKRVVLADGEEVHLTPIEFKLLRVLVRHAGRVITQRQLLNEVWGPHHMEQAHYLRVYMAQLRRKLEVEPARPRHFLTEPGVGYRLVGDLAC